MRDCIFNYEHIRKAVQVKWYCLKETFPKLSFKTDHIDKQKNRPMLPEFNLHDNKSYSAYFYLSQNLLLIIQKK